MGDETARNFRYQHSYGVILLAAGYRGDRPYAAIWCEHHEDILAERNDGLFDAWQVKTRLPGAGVWTLTNADFLGALEKFSRVDVAFGAKIKHFYFASNVGFAEAGESAQQKRLISSPIAFLAAVQASPSPSALSGPFEHVLKRFADRCGVSAEQMFQTMSRVNLVVGPSRGEMEASLSNEHLARIELHAHRSAVELDGLRDALVAKVARASSLHVTDPERHLRALNDPDARDPTYEAKRVPVEAICEAGSPYLNGEPESGIASLHAKFDNLAQRLGASGMTGGLNYEQVLSLLRAFSDVDIDPLNAMDLLLRKASELRALQEEIARRVAADTQDSARFAPIFEAFDAGDLDKADSILNELASSGANMREATLVETAHLYVLRADLAMARLRFQDAADHFGTAAALVGVFDRVLAFDFLGVQAQIYVDQALLFGGRPPFERAFEVSRRRIEMAPENSEQRFNAMGQLISHLGIASERAPAPEAQRLTQIALDLGRPLLESLDPTRHTDIWVPLANTLGAVLNSAARFSYPEEDPTKVAEQAIGILKRAEKVARRKEHSELSNIESNLATAYRRRATRSSEPERDIKKSIMHRLRALRFEMNMSNDQLGNAYDSLGNDYSQLVQVDKDFNHDAFRRAMVAYRRALPFRPKEMAPINWARTQFNVANNYARACRFAVGQDLRRYGLASLARYEFALSVLSPESSPHDWAQGCFQSTLVVANMIDADCDPGTDRIEWAITRLAEVANVADGTGDVEMVIQTLDMQAGFARHLFARRSSEAARLIGFAHKRLKGRLGQYRYTPIRLLFSLADAQFSFMLAHLAGDSSSVDDAIAVVEACIYGPATDEERSFVELAQEVIGDMREMRAQMGE